MMKENERQVIRDLAKKLADLANQPIMEERRKLWYAHNDLKTDQPVIDCSPEGAWRHNVPADTLICEDPLLREIEWTLRARIFRAEVINDDVPAEMRWDCRKIISDTGWSVEGQKAHNAFTNESVHVPTISTINPFWRPGYNFDETAAEFEPLISDDDMEDEDIASRLIAPKVIYDEEASKRMFDIHQELLGDILDVQWTGNTYIAFSWMETYTKIRGYENALYDLYDYPEQMHKILAVLEKGYLDLYQQQLDMGLLSMNNGCQYNGTGGFGYTNDIKAPAPGEKLTFKNLWAYAESQEFISVSPEMTKEFAIDYEKRLLEKFGLSAYGCCDNLEKKVPDILKIDNIRRISVSPWADVESMRDQIGMKAIFSCKPNPSYITGGWDEDLMRKDTMRLMQAGKGTAFEIILKDTHTIQDPQDFRRWTDLCRECAAKVFG
ncbi:MAG: hypothetical protein KH050_00905 [Clostridiaceae bacterium]|nr:hypothetical protein [Clostridiaceae bacterium]